MARTLFLLFIFISTAYLVFISSEFKVVATGIAIFLVGMFFIEDGFREFAGSLPVVFYKLSLRKAPIHCSRLSPADFSLRLSSKVHHL